MDLVKLEVSFKALQRKIHPDKFATASAEERAHAEQVRQTINHARIPPPPLPLPLTEERAHVEQHSSLVNDAVATLRCPLRRALHLLELAGVLQDEHASTTITDPALLTRVMEARMEVRLSARLCNVNRSSRAPPPTAPPRPI